MSSVKRTLGAFIPKFLYGLEMLLEKIKKHQKGESYGNE